MRFRNALNREKTTVIMALFSLVNFIFPQNVQAAMPDPVDIIQDSVEYRLDPGLPGLPEIKDREARKTIILSVTAYSSSPDECSGDPFITASGSHVQDGTIAYNFLPFGTKVRFPEVFGNKVFTVEDRMAAYKGKYIADIWMPSKAEAIQWGVKVLKMEIL